LLAVAYARRKRWEARLQAVEIVDRLGQALGGGKRGAGRAAGKRVSGDALLREMGAL